MEFFIGKVALYSAVCYNFNSIFDWRYHYPEFDNTQKRVKVVSQGMSDLLIEALKEDK